MFSLWTLICIAVVSPFSFVATMLHASKLTKPPMWMLAVAGVSFIAMWISWLTLAVYLP